MCGKQMGTGKAQSQTPEMSEARGLNPAEDKKEITNGSHDVKEEEQRPLQEGNTEPSKHSTPSKFCNCTMFKSPTRRELEFCDMTTQTSRFNFDLHVKRQLYM